MKKGPKHPHRLIVEGKDKHAIIHLMSAHGADFDVADSFAPYVEAGVGAEGDGEEAGGKAEALKGFLLALRSPGMRRVGLVLDADEHALDRWCAVRDRLHEQGVEAPAGPDPTGWVDETAHGARVGVWIMPDNLRPGRLEELVEGLIPADDPCIDHAREAARRARELGAPFRPVDQLKAELHTWLAWRRNPGVPFGTAIKARYLAPEGPAARSFVAWFMRLFRDPRP